MVFMLAGALLLSIGAMRVTRALGLERWQVSLGLLLLGVCLYTANVVLIRRYIRERAPEFANNDSWEHTAGLGIVPRWVSVLGLLAYSALVAALLPWLAVLMRLM